MLFGYRAIPLWRFEFGLSIHVLRLRHVRLRDFVLRRFPQDDEFFRQIPCPGDAVGRSVVHRARRSGDLDDRPDLPPPRRRAAVSVHRRNADGRAPVPASRRNGASFAPQEIAVTYSQSHEFARTEALVGCKARFAQAANHFIFDGKWLDESAKLGNRTTYAVVVSLCDELLADLTLRTGAAGKIRASLLQDIARRPTLSATAKQVGTTARTLRRQLALQGTSSRALVDELRAQVAVKYLRETAMTNENIAVALGFSDAANFRHAFRRWTGSPPRAFRFPGRPSHSRSTTAASSPEPS